MKNKDHIFTKLGFTIFLSLSAAVAFAFVLFRLHDVLQVISRVVSTLNPLFIGIALAYILRPMALAIEKGLKNVKFLAKARRPLSVLITVIIGLCLVSLFVGMIVPQLAATIRNLIQILPDQVENAILEVETFLRRDEAWADRLIQMVSSSEEKLIGWVESNLLSSLGTLASNLYSIGSFLINLLMSVIVAIYLLLGWERYVAQMKKLYLAIFKNKHLNGHVFTALKQTNRIFSGFINGKLLDSLIVGILCFIVLSILRMPYTMLISVVVGVTNIIPVFGPFIGAIPCAFLVLLISPTQCLVFLIFIVILQQIDGNIIGPKILGNSTGLSALYVMTAMLIFGKLMGFVGMVIGVPLFATLFYLVKQIGENSLKKQGMSTVTEDYISDNYK